MVGVRTSRVVKKKFFLSPLAVVEIAHKTFKKKRERERERESSSQIVAAQEQEGLGIENNECL